MACKYTVLLQVLAVFLSCNQRSTSAFVITEGPQNLTVQEGETAIFPCSYTETLTYPVWYINASSYTVTASWQLLPPRHTYSISQQKMIVTDVQLSDSGTTYRCLFFHSGQVLYSDTAALTVVTASQDTTNIIIEVTTGLTKNMAVTTTRVMSTEEITSNLLTTTTDVTDTPAVTAKGGQELGPSDSALFVTELAAKKDEIMHKVYAGIASCVGIILVVCIAIIILILWLIRRIRSRQTQKPNLQEHVYEDIPNVLISAAEVKMDPNVCYSRGKQTEPDYAEINNIVKPKSCGECVQQSDKDYNIMVSKVALVRLNTYTE